MPATLEEAYNDPYSISKRKYEASFLSQDNNTSCPSRTSSFIRNPITMQTSQTSHPSQTSQTSHPSQTSQLNFGEIKTMPIYNKIAQNAGTMPNMQGTMPNMQGTNQSINQEMRGTTPNINTKSVPKKKKKHRKVKKQKGGRRHRKSKNKHFLFFVNVIFGLIIIFAFALSKKYFAGY
jgi:hypothetical protein